MADIGKGQCPEHIFIDDTIVLLPGCSFTSTTAGTYLCKYNCTHLFLSYDPLTPPPMSGSLDLYINNILVHSGNLNPALSDTGTGNARSEVNESFMITLAPSDVVELRGSIITGGMPIIEKKVKEAKFIIMEP